MITRTLVERVAAARAEVEKIILGKTDVVREVFTALLAGGHILLEDIPGVGKTTLALALARVTELTFGRIQFTPDLMPADLTGYSVYNRQTEQFVYMPGTVFCNLLLADEINRTSPKTQAALLEVMEERAVTVEGVTRRVPEPFMIMATQNPAGSAGTQNLPESQLDRFLISMTLGYPDEESEFRMAKGSDPRRRIPTLQKVLTGEDIARMQAETEGIFISDELLHYLIRLVEMTRQDARIRLGGSPRATLALLNCAKASAYLAGREYVVPADITGQFPYVIRHRLILTAAAGAAGFTRDKAAAEILRAVPQPSMVRRR